MEKTPFENSTNSGEVRLQNKLFYEFYEHLKFISKTFTKIEFQIMEKNNFQNSGEVRLQK